jgi:hypothetical protein
MEEFSEAPLLVLSASKTTSLLLESVLVEAGMLRVAREVGTGETGAENGRPRPAAVVVDAQAPPAAQLAGLAGLFSEEEQEALPWIVCGSESEAQALHSWVRGPTSRLEYPINPVRYIKQVRAALGPRETAHRWREPPRSAERSRN